MKGLVVLFALVAAPAWATEQEVSAYGLILRSCYAETPDTDAKEACLGGISTACMETEEGGQTTLGITWCLSAEADVWDELLNDEYAQARDQAKAADADEAAYFPDYAVRVDKLLAAQRAWIAFRDAECALEYAEWGAGSMRNIAFADCRMTMTAERTLDLRRMWEMPE